MVGSLFGHSTFMLESIGTLCSRQNTLSLSENFLANFSDDCLNSSQRPHHQDLWDLIYPLAATPKRNDARQLQRASFLSSGISHALACGPTSCDDASPAASSATDLSPCHLSSPLWCRKMPFVHIFLFGSSF